jgi:hypothetical protein
MGGLPLKLFNLSIACSVLLILSGCYLFTELDSDRYEFGYVVAFEIPNDCTYSKFQGKGVELYFLGEYYPLAYYDQSTGPFGIRTSKWVPYGEVLHIEFDLMGVKTDSLFGGADDAWIEITAEMHLPFKTKIGTYRVEFPSAAIEPGARLKEKVRLLHIDGEDGTMDCL